MASFHFRIKSGKKGAAVTHADYISRHGRFSRKDDLVGAESGNLPDWAEGNTRAFWRASDRHERKNGASYRELVFALPTGLTSEQNMEIVRRYVKEVIRDRPYCAAVHCSTAAIGGCTNLHAHVMYSDRIPDGVARSAEQTFRRYNPANPSAGGCKKASGGRKPMQLREELIEMRRRCAVIQNETLAKYGHESRVDHRTLKAQGSKRVPERHLGPARVKRMTQAERKAFNHDRRRCELSL